MAKTMRLSLIVLAIFPAFGQLAEEPQPVALGQCPQPTALDSSGKPLIESFAVRSVSLSHPFQFLPWIRRQVDGVRSRLTVKQGDFFSLEKQEADFEMLKASFPLPDTDFVPFAIRVAVVTVNVCNEGKLDLTYQILSSQFSPVSTATIESREREPEQPQDAAGVVPAKTVRVVPKAGYNHSDRLFGGGSLRIRSKGKAPGIDSIDLDGAASVLPAADDAESSYRFASGALNGSFSPESFGTIDWRLGYNYRSLPTNSSGLKESRFEGQVLATTRPRSEAGVVLRFGGMLEGGNLQSGFQSAVLGPDTIASAGYGSFRLYAGTTFGTKHHSFSSSYGIELGANGGLGADWRKQVGDVIWNVWFPIGDHRPLQIESRFTAGGIQIGSGAQIPVAKRFFGGNAQESFVAGEGWDFRANPMIRSIPARRFNLTSDGVGAESFYSLNLTAAPVVWRATLLPAEVTEDEGFKQQIQGQWDFFKALSAARYLQQDPELPNVFAGLPGAKSALEGLQSAVAAANTSAGTGTESLFRTCLSTIRTSVRRISTALDEASSAEDRYGAVGALVRNGLLAKTLDECETKLNGTLKDTNITAASAALGRAREKTETAYQKIDRSGAEKRAARELRYPQRVFNTILHDVNLWSVSPVFIFDTAHIWPAARTVSGLRYGVGGGVRLILVSHANITFGYARNLNREPREGSGALFFSIAVTELLR